MLAGTKKSPNGEVPKTRPTGQDQVRIAALVALVIVSAALPAVSFWLNGGPVQPFGEIVEMDPEKSGEEETSEGLLGNWRTNREFFSSSLRGFHVHDGFAAALIERLQRSRFDPDSGTFAANAIITHHLGLSSILEYQRSRSVVLYEHVIYGPTFGNNEWYYNRSMKHAFGIDPEASWEIDRHDIFDALHVALTTQKDYTAILAEPTTGLPLGEYPVDEIYVDWYSRQDVDSLLQLGMRLMGQRKSSEARYDQVDSLYLLMLETDPDNPVVASGILSLVDQYMQRNDTGRAYSLAEKAARLQPKLEALVPAIEGFRYMNTVPRSTDKAIEAFRKSIELYPTVHVHNNLATLLYEKGEYQEAYESAKQAMQLLGESPPDRVKASVLDTVGFIALRLGLLGDEDKLVEGEKLLEIAYNLDKDNPIIGLHYGAALYNSPDQAVRTNGLAHLNRVRTKGQSLQVQADALIAEIDELRKQAGDR
jgi:tetratricopeptide (TPR) repeat protein